MYKKIPGLHALSFNASLINAGRIQPGRCGPRVRLRGAGRVEGARKEGRGFSSGQEGREGKAGASQPQPQPHRASQPQWQLKRAQGTRPRRQISRSLLVVLFAFQMITF